MTEMTLSLATLGLAPSAGARIRIDVLAPGPGGLVRESSRLLVGAVEAESDADGEWSGELTPNEDLSPAGSAYLLAITGKDGARWEVTFVVPSDPFDPVSIADCLVSRPTQVAWEMPAAFQAAYKGDPGAPGADGADGATGADGAPGGPAADAGVLTSRPAPGDVDQGYLYTATDEDGGTAYVKLGALGTGSWVALPNGAVEALGLVNALPEWNDGIGTTLDTSVPGFLSLNRSVVVGSQTADVASTTAETTLAPLALTAQHTTENRFVRYRWRGGFANNSGSPSDVTFRVKHAGGTAFTMTWNAVPSVSGTRWFEVQGVVQTVTFGAGLTLIAGTLQGRMSGVPAESADPLGGRSAGSAAVFFTEGTSISLLFTGQMSVSNAATVLSGTLAIAEVIG